MKDQLWGDSPNLLRTLAAVGEMEGQELVRMVLNQYGDYRDFYPLAAMIHAGFIISDTTTNAGSETIRGKLGVDVQDTCIFLQQLRTPSGEVFYANDVQRKSAHDFPIRFFVTGEGYLRLDQLEVRAGERRRKRNDYIVTVGVALLAAALSWLVNGVILRPLPVTNPCSFERPVENR